MIIVHLYIFEKPRISIMIIISSYHKGSIQSKFSVKARILSQGGGGLTQSQLFQTKTTTIQKGDFVGICCNMAGFPSPNQKIKKNFKNHTRNHQKMGLFHEKIILYIRGGGWVGLVGWRVGGGSCRMGPNPIFYHKFVLNAPLISSYQL